MQSPIPFISLSPSSAILQPPYFDAIPFITPATPPVKSPVIPNLGKRVLSSLSLDELNRLMRVYKRNECKATNGIMKEISHARKMIKNRISAKKSRDQAYREKERMKRELTQLEERNRRLERELEVANEKVNQLVGSNLGLKQSLKKATHESSVMDKEIMHPILNTIPCYICGLDVERASCTAFRIEGFRAMFIAHDECYERTNSDCNGLMFYIREDIDRICENPVIHPFTGRWKCVAPGKPREFTYPTVTRVKIEVTTTLTDPNLSEYNRRKKRKSLFEQMVQSLKKILLDREKRYAVFNSDTKVVKDTFKFDRASQKNVILAYASVRLCHDSKESPVHGEVGTNARRELMRETGFAIGVDVAFEIDVPKKINK